MMSSYHYYYYYCFHYHLCQFINFLILFFCFVCLFVLFCFLFLLLIKQLLFSHGKIKVSRLLCLFVCLFCLLSWNCGLIIHNFIVFLQFPPKRFTIFFIKCYFNIILHFIWVLFISLPLVLLWIYFNRLHGSYQWAENRPENGPQSVWRHSADPRMFGDILHSLMF